MKGSNILEWYIYVVLFRLNYSHLQITFLKKYFGQSVEDDDSCQSVVYRANSFIPYYNQLEGNVMKKRHGKDKDSERFDLVPALRWNLKTGSNPSLVSGEFWALALLMQRTNHEWQNFWTSKMAERDRKKRRKRKDSTTHLKPPLDFIESPLDGRKYYCTPVQAARRPFMAESFPVDDEEAKKWVC